MSSDVMRSGGAIPKSLRDKEEKQASTKGNNKCNNPSPKGQNKNKDMIMFTRTKRPNATKDSGLSQPKQGVPDSYHRGAEECKSPDGMPARVDRKFRQR